MAQHRPCGNTECTKTTAVKYRFCHECRGKGLRARGNQFMAPTVAVPDDALDTAQTRMESDVAKLRIVREHATLKTRYAEALKTIERQQRDQEVFGELKTNVEPFLINPRHGSGTSEACPVLVASDWHAEERVDPASVSGLNTHNLEIFHDRSTSFFQSGLRLVRLLNQDVTINTVVLALLGDFISNDIHDEVAEVAEVPPTNALVLVQNVIISGIEFWLNHSTYDIRVVCKSGNHGRTTKTTRFATENGHSLEYLMYLHLDAYFRNEPRVTFLIEDGIHSYVPIYDKTLRFHHGHAVKYGGGVGGITIPVNKAIAQWNKGRHADIDVFGHFHQSVDGRNFVCNGSQIGYNAFAMSIKADYEPPMQTLFLMDKKRGRTCRWPILYNR